MDKRWCERTHVGADGGGGGDEGHASARGPHEQRGLFRRGEVAVAKCTVAGMQIRGKAGLGDLDIREVFARALPSAAARRLTPAGAHPPQVPWCGWLSTRTRRAGITTRTCISSAQSSSRAGCRSRRASTSRISRSPSPAFPRI